MEQYSGMPSPYGYLPPYPPWPWYYYPQLPQVCHPLMNSEQQKSTRIITVDKATQMGELQDEKTVELERAVVALQNQLKEADEKYAQCEIRTETLEEENQLLRQ